MPERICIDCGCVFDAPAHSPAIRCPECQRIWEKNRHKRDFKSQPPQYQRDKYINSSDLLHAPVERFFKLVQGVIDQDITLVR